MAKLNKDSLLHGISGSIGEDLVFKNYANKTIVSKKPDMSKVKPSHLQLLSRERFAKATAYAKHINNNPELRAAYQKKLQPGESVYHYAMKEFKTLQLG
jgi:spore coat protein CotF